MASVKSLCIFRTPNTLELAEDDRSGVQDVVGLVISIT